MSRTRIADREHSTLLQSRSARLVGQVGHSLTKMITEARGKGYGEGSQMLTSAIPIDYHGGVLKVWNLFPGALPWRCIEVFGPTRFCLLHWRRCSSVRPARSRLTPFQTSPSCP